MGKQGASQKERSLTGRQVLDIVIVENTWTWTVGNISLRTPWVTTLRTDVQETVGECEQGCN